MAPDFSNHAVEFLTDEDLPGLEIRSSFYQGCSFSKHTHDTFSVGIILSGEGRYTQSGTTHSIGRGHVILVPPDEVHACNPLKKSPWAYLMFHLSRELLLEVASDLVGEYPRNLVFPARVLFDSDIRRLMIHLFNVVKKRATLPEKESAMCRALSELLIRHGKLAPARPPQSNEARTVGMIKEYLAHHLERNVSMHELAQVAGINVYHLLHVFRRQAGISPHAYQVQIRIKEARKLLQKGYSIVDAALETGFCDQSHFTKKFKPSVGLTPRNYILAHHSD